MPPAPSPRTTAEERLELCAAQLTRMMEVLKAQYPDGKVPALQAQLLTAQFQCPAASQLTYSLTGSGSADVLDLCNLTIFCRGKHHADAGAPENFPEIHSVRGLDIGVRTGPRRRPYP